MPEIYRFLGIIITMYFEEHNPPHFHVKHNEYRASVEIKSLNILAGKLPAKIFSQFFLDSWPTLAWECGFDIAPEAIYEKC